MEAHGFEFMITQPLDTLLFIGSIGIVYVAVFWLFGNRKDYGDDFNKGRGIL